MYLQLLDTNETPPSQDFNENQVAVVSEQSGLIPTTNLERRSSPVFDPWNDDPAAFRENFLKTAERERAFRAEAAAAAAQKRAREESERQRVAQALVDNETQRWQQEVARDPSIKWRCDLKFS